MGYVGSWASGKGFRVKVVGVKATIRRVHSK